MRPTSGREPVEPAQALDIEERRVLQTRLMSEEPREVVRGIIGGRAGATVRGLCEPRVV